MFRDARQLRQEDCRFYGISRDSRFTHKAFKESSHLKHDLLADMKGDVARLYGCWNEELGFSERLTAVIDPDGTIVYLIHNAAGNARDHHEALNTVRGLQTA